ncbi:amidase domain-containing protein [Niallia sp. Krafla_26]|uniref:amidase domain-containing protein n=1 Tax=Niallia sp. Krafla_26 TaxID=3064703 RepID=UPI003D17B7C2
MRKQLQDHLQKRVQQYVSSLRSETQDEKIEKKRETCNRRQAEIVKVNAKGSIDHVDKRSAESEHVQYHVHLQYLIKQKGLFLIEEEMETRQAEFYKGVLVADKELDPFQRENESDFPMEEPGDDEDQQERIAFQYNRQKAVQYAERWWNDYNPAYKNFKVDCTNYVSQCLHQGGAPMRGHPNRSQGWWMQNNNWSYSWSVAHALQLHLKSSKSGLRAREVSNPEELLPGDVICYDFEGDGRFNHNTIVTGKDANGMPLVNAHTANSRMRYWAYEDSTAYTPNIQYKFFTIMDDS